MRVSAIGIGTILVGVFMVSCSPNPKDGQSDLDSSKWLPLSKLHYYQPEIRGPQIVFEGETIELKLINRPNEALSLKWKVDGRPYASDIDTIQFDAGMVDYHRFDLELHFDGDEVLTTPYFVTVIGYQDGLSCLKDLKIQSQTVFFDDESVVANLVIPSCLESRVSGARWSVQNGSEISSISKIYDFGKLNEGQYILNADVFGSNQRDLLFKLRFVVTVLERPKSEEHVDLCSIEGQTQIVSELEDVTEIPCGLNGKKTQIRKIIKKNRCERTIKGNLDWVTQPQEIDVISESECRGQSCVFNMGEASEILADGQIKFGVVTGHVVTPLECQHQEQGYYKKFNKLSDFQCDNGAIKLLQRYQSDVVEERSCPQYRWVALDTWTECSENCGGTQTREYSCMDQYQNISDGNRCGLNLERESRLCDRDPLAAAYEVKTEREEHANSSQKCSANQIGAIIRKRTVTLTERYACINHGVTKVNESVTYSDWVTESFCRDYVASRCSHDSLSIQQAKGRYQWMIKCQNELPKVKHFIDQHHEFGIRDKNGRSFDTKRPLYASFMQIKKGKEVVWRAPVNPGSPCQMPETAYVAAVCVSSCATPDQYILVKEHANLLPKFLRFDEAYTQKIPFVMTLNTNVLNSRNNITHSRVDQWVTEVVDTVHDIRVIKLKSGGQLKLTPNHPMVIPDGSLKLVQDLKVGDKLVQRNGQPDVITEIRDTKYFGKVYNIFTQSSSPQHNIVFINDYMSGSAMFQNEAANLINRRILRSKLINGVKLNYDE